MSPSIGHTRIAIFGSSFDPIHNGHLSIMTTIVKTLHPDQLILLPSKLSPNKTTTHASEQHRLSMLNLAISTMKASSTNIQIDPMELSGPSPSYTIHSIRRLKEKHPKNTQFFLIIGQDNYQTFHQWKEYKTLLGEVHLVVINRPNYKKENLKIASYAHQIKHIVMEEIHTSSSQIRNLISQKKAITAHVPKGIADYIHTHHLYQD